MDQFSIAEFDTIKIHTSYRLQADSRIRSGYLAVDLPEGWKAKIKGRCLVVKPKSEGSQPMHVHNQISGQSFSGVVIQTGYIGGRPQSKPEIVLRHAPGDSLPNIEMKK